MTRREVQVGVVAWAVLVALIFVAAFIWNEQGKKHGRESALVTPDRIDGWRKIPAVLSQHPAVAA